VLCNRSTHDLTVSYSDHECTQRLRPLSIRACVAPQAADRAKESASERYGDLGPNLAGCLGSICYETLDDLVHGREEAPGCPFQLTEASRQRLTLSRCRRITVPLLRQSGAAVATVYLKAPRG
jgi:hypothetical protein